MRIPKRDVVYDRDRASLSGTQRGAPSPPEDVAEKVPSVLKARCWCNTETVNVEPELIRAAQTVSCGREGCRKGVQR